MKKSGVLSNDWLAGLNPETLHDAVDFYYGLGALINFYSHSLSATTAEDNGRAVVLTGDYVAYCMDAGRFPRLWSSNARGVYDWWLKRSMAQITTSYGTNGNHSVATVTITGSQDTNTAIEILAPGSGSAIVYHLRTNDVAATTDSYRTSGELIKVRVGTSVTNVQVEYYPGPFARNDTYTMSQGQSLTVAQASGVLSNDWSGTWSGLRATNVSGPSHGVLTLNTNGGFSYTPTNSFWGTECFNYHATDGTNDFGQAAVTIFVTRTNALFSDDFTRCLATLVPRQVYSGTWSLGSGAMQGSSRLGEYAFSYLANSWTNYSVEAKLQFPAGAFGGGIGGRLNPATGAHYAAWVYPEGSIGGSNVLALIKFATWENWGIATHGTPSTRCGKIKRTKSDRPNANSSSPN